MLSSSPITGAVVGAYAASPAHAIWHPTLEARFFAALDAIDTVRGLELPWLGSLHPHDSDWLLSHLPRRFENVLTDIGATVGALQADVTYGLASTNRGGRRSAVQQAARLRDDARRLNDTVGSNSVLAVELHSAPLAAAGSAEMLAASVAEIASWDWDGASLVIEHCDAQVPGQTPEKGYLHLVDELRALSLSGTNVGISLNWGRSAIELRSAAAVLEHVSLASSSGLLRGLMFSGAADTAGAFGRAWLDAHLPMAPTDSFPLGEPTSLLTETVLRDCVRAAGSTEWIGIKYGWTPPSSPVGDRVRMIADGIGVLLGAHAGNPAAA